MTHDRIDEATAAARSDAASTGELPTPWPAEFVQPPAATAASTRVAVIGLALGGLFILALGFWLGSRPRTPAIPALTIVEPAAGAVIDRPIELVFDVDHGRLRVGPGGWGVGTIHVHAWIDGRELMPAAADIEPIGEARYRWTIAHAEPGERALHIGWSDLYHQPIAEGMSATVRVTIR
jgi:hypothetical protein